MGLSESAFENALMLEALPILGVQGSPPPLGELDAEFLGDGVELGLFLRLDEDEGGAFVSSAGGAAAAVGVVFELVGQLVMQHEAQAGHVDAASGHIGGDEEL